MTKLRLAEAAKSDIREIRAFSKATFGLRTGREYVAGLNSLFVVLRTNPLVGAPQLDLGDSIRRFPYRSHRVFYRVTPELVTIARILHHAQDERLHFGAP